MSARATVLSLFALSLSTLIGCGPNKGVEKGTEKNIVIDTSANLSSLPTRPSLPAEAKSKKGPSDNPKK
jgi:hypothetical protein